MILDKNPGKLQVFYDAWYYPRIDSHNPGVGSIHYIIGVHKSSVEKALREVTAGLKQERPVSARQWHINSVKYYEAKKRLHRV